MIWTSLIAQGKRKLLMSLLVSLLIALVYFHFARFYQGRGTSWLFALGWIPVGLNVLRAGLGLAYRLDRLPFRALDLGLAADEVSPGGSVEIELHAEARRDAVLSDVSTELLCTRHEIREGKRHTSILHSERTVLASDEAIAKGRRARYRASLPIPPDAPYSFRSMEGRIRWSLRLRIEVPNWGELRDELDLTVAPG